MIWRSWKVWPHTFPYPDITWCTDDELRWLEFQRLIDDGLKCCDACNSFGWHDYCGGCGRRYLSPELVQRDCPSCKAQVVTDYCSFCGAWVAIPFLKRLERGEVDWIEEARKARDALCGLVRKSPRLTDPQARDPYGRTMAVAEILRRVTGHGN